MQSGPWAMNLTPDIGDQVPESGRHIHQLSGVGRIINAPSEELADSLALERTISRYRYLMRPPREQEGAVP